MNDNLSIPAGFDFQGHRGARGLYPENTIEGFKLALDYGVTTLEMDVVISADSQVVVSHEPWFSHEIAIDPKGKEIDLSDERNHNIYEMGYADISAYDIGSKKHERFPEQANQSEKKPLLSEVIEASENYAKELDRSAPYYNIETKSIPERDDIYHPKPEVFCELLIGVLKEKGIGERTYIQSFDVRTLQYIHEKYPEFKLVLLIENKSTPQDNLELLGFVPEVYSPDFALVDEDLISFCKEKKMKVIPWTVNEKSEMEDLIRIGVDGLITDYPDRFNELKSR